MTNKNTLRDKAVVKETNCVKASFDTYLIDWGVPHTSGALPDR